MDSPSVNKAPMRPPQLAGAPMLAPTPANSTHSDETFDTFIEDSGDIRGMIAYCIYRFHKKQQFDNKGANDSERVAFARHCITGRQYDAIKSQASEVVGRFTDRIIINHSRSKFLKDVTVGIVTGIITAMLAPFVWYGVQAAIISSGAAAEAQKVIVGVNPSNVPSQPSLPQQTAPQE